MEVYGICFRSVFYTHIVFQFVLSPGDRGSIIKVQIAD